MKIIYSLFYFIFAFLTCEYTLAQNPTYNLTAKNFQLGSINFPNDVLYFDVYIEWTNSGVVPNFELAGSQLYFSFNKNVLDLSGNYWPDGGTPPGTSASPDSSRFSYKIVESDLPISMIPRNNSIWTATSPSANILRGAINVFPGAGFGINIPAGFPGTKICRYRLWNKTRCFNLNTLDIAWRNPPIVAFATKIFAYVGTTGTELTTSATHSIEFNNFPLGCVIIPPVILNFPENNAINNPLSSIFLWRKNISAYKYKFILSTDIEFNNIVFLDSTLTDTFTNVSNLNLNTTYFWKVLAIDLNNFYGTSETWNFTTTSGIVLNLKFIQEGLYNRFFNLLNRKDNVEIYLRNNSPPYAIADTAIKKIDSVTFSTNLVFQNTQTGYFYIVIRHLNTLETWSKSGGQYLKLDSTVNYDFTISASQAYGNNLKLRGSKYCAYAGDVDQNGFIDGDDLSMIDNDVFHFTTGANLPSDLNGDNIVDGIDFLIGDNNWQYITVKSPLNTSDAGFKFRVKKFKDP